MPRVFSVCHAECGTHMHRCTCVAEIIRYHPLFFISSRQGLSLNLELTRAQFRHPTRPTPHPVSGLVTVALYGFSVGAGDSNWGPHAYAAGTTEPCPSLKSLNLKIGPWLRLGLPANLSYCAYFFDKQTRACTFHFGSSLPEGGSGPWSTF